MDEDVSRDPALAAALRRAEPEPPFAEVDWERMRATLNARAELPLARLRAADAAVAPATVPTRATGPRGRALHWLVPLAAAAGVAGLMVAGPLRSPAAGPAAPPSAVAVQPAPATGDASVDEILAATLPEHVNRAIDGQADEDALASGALGS